MLDPLLRATDAKMTMGPWGLYGFYWGKTNVQVRKTLRYYRCYSKGTSMEFFKGRDEKR